MDPSEAVKPHPQGCIISFEIVSGASRLAVPSGCNPWRKSLEAHLTEEPVRGRANRQLMEELARVLVIPGQDVELIAGHKSPKKTVLVRGMKRDEASRRLGEALSQPAGSGSGGGEG